MGQSKGAQKNISKIVGAMPISSSDKAIARSVAGSTDLSDTETVNRLAGQVFNRPVGNFGINKPKNMYTQQAALGSGPIYEVEEDQNA
jgi:hypothetical protein